MNTQHSLSWSWAILSACAALASGCGGAKPPVEAPSDAAKAPPAPPSAASATTSQSSSPSTVSISDEIRAKCGIPDAEAYFAFDSARVTSKDRTPLDLVVKCFTNGPLAGHAVKLVGHADPRGSSDYNMTLGESRADSVASYLGVRGMAKDKTLPTSRGAMDAEGNDEAGWQHDRRVDVLLGD